VWLCLHHCPAASPTGFARAKLAPQYYGPYKVIGRVGSVAYCLSLPPWARLHDVSHVSQLKKFHGEPPAVPPALPCYKMTR
jgi:hypothetical protein